MSSLIRGAAVAALSCLAVAKPAHAAGVVYTDKGNVWVATPDGSVNRALTTGGTEQEPASPPREQLVGPYLYASADDAGRVTAKRNRYSADGADNWFWVFMGADGKPNATNIVSMYQCGGYIADSPEWGRERVSCYGNRPVKSSRTA